MNNVPLQLVSIGASSSKVVCEKVEPTAAIAISGLKIGVAFSGDGNEVSEDEW